MNLNLAGAHILITGGAGFIGSHIADQALEAGAARVVIIDDFVRGRRENLDQAIRTGRVEVVVDDICDTALMERLTERIDIIFHQAALRITHCAEQPLRAVQVMIKGTQNVLDAAVRHKVKRVLAASSASVYGEPSYLPMDEAHPFNNRTLYGALKISNEQIMRAYAEMYGLQYVAFRPFNVYGPRMDVFGAYTEVMIRWLQRIATGQRPIIFGDGMQSMDFVYVEDVARAYIQAAVAGVTDDVFNLGSGTQTSLRDLCRLVCEVSGAGNLQPIFEPARKVNPVTRRQAAIGKARKAIRFEASTSLPVGLKALISWHESILQEKKGTPLERELALR